MAPITCSGCSCFIAARNFAPADICSAISAFQRSCVEIRGYPPRGLSPSRGIETFGAPPLMLPYIGPWRNSSRNGVHGPSEQGGYAPLSPQGDFPLKGDRDLRCANPPSQRKH